MTSKTMVKIWRRYNLHGINIIVIALNLGDRNAKDLFSHEDHSHNARKDLLYNRYYLMYDGKDLIYYLNDHFIGRENGRPNEEDLFVCK